ncbi:rifin [Plasmodium falciparum IGH-CR14]|uniref:Rifin n=2 Tax=Plasmodium falciparum TaxID=5833 RepID=A0A0L1I3T1_PLAFA|nr:hypothetical protein PFNF135_00665 [Plasmodium falciparum NF135/5.C10]KNG74284.1 rifin [Plasmodium falciparum IGH-CR14]
MKLHYTNILLFSLPLNILAHNKNKQYISARTPTITSRMLSECDINTSIYDTDPDMKTMKENFDRQTSQRFDEYNERMNKNRQKCKEQCEKDIEQIVAKDKIEKTLTEKVEKGCLRCGCGLGGVAAGVGIIGPIAVNEWTKAATIAAIASAKEAGAAEGAAAGAQAGINVVMDELYTEFGILNMGVKELGFVLDAMHNTNVSNITQAVYTKFDASCISPLVRSASSSLHVPGANEPICSFVMQKSAAAINSRSLVWGESVSYTDVIREGVESIVSHAETTYAAVTESNTEKAIATITAQKTGVVDATCANCHIAIISTIVAILVIVLVMVIIYLILRYRRKKKMKKKFQYINLLKE